MGPDALAIYVKDVLAGDRIVGELERLAVERHVRDLEECESRGLYFDEDAAGDALDFFPFLTHSKGVWAGEPFELAPWQAFLVGSLFGWMRADGLRRFRTAYVEVPRKNGKSTLWAGIGLFLLVADGEQGAEVYTAATKRDQARIVHAEAVRMVKKSPFLRRMVGSVRDNLHVEATASKYEPLGADADTLDGLNPHGMVIDELHAHRNRRMWDVLDTATGSRAQPVLAAITTAGFDRETVCWEQHDYAQRILRGVLEDDSYFAFISAADEGDDWREPLTWQKANPNLGISVRLDDLERKALQAASLPGKQNAFRRLHLNEWTQQEDRWLDLEAWNACDGAVDLDELEGQRCYGGLDLATTTDITAFILVFPPAEEGGVVCFWPWLWVPEENARAVNGELYEPWIRDGWIHTTAGDVLDHDFVCATIEELSERFCIEEIAFDRWGAQSVSNRLLGAGLDMVQFGQGFASMSAPTKELERMVLSRRLAHGGHPVMRWMADNVVVEQDAAGNLKPNKKKARDKIDGIVALIMAIARLVVHENEAQGSIYEQRGPLILE